jgi:parvulin-like peptidyl-prolyl isomerase
MRSSASRFLAAVAVGAMTFGLCHSGAWSQTKPARPSATASAPEGRSHPKVNRPTGQPKNAKTDSQATDLAAKPKIVAVINGEPITREVLAKECLRRHGNLVLESLVNKVLIFQECKAQRIEVTQKDIDAEISTIAGKFQLSVDKWLELLKNERHISAEQYRRDIIWPTLALKRLVADKLVVSQNELAKEFESEYGPKVQVRMISVGSRQNAEQILAEVTANPDDFGKIAKNKSQDTNSAAARGLIPPIGKHVGDENIERAVFALKPGEISPIVPFADQFVIFKCERMIPPTEISPSQKEVALERLKDRIIDRDLRVASAELSQKLQNDAKVVNVLNDKELSAKSPGVAAIINGKQIPISQLSEECVVRHGTDVLESLVNVAVLKQALKRRGAQVERQELNDEVARAAESYGYLTKDNKPDIKTWLKEVTEREGMSVEIYLDDAVWPTVALKKLVSDQVTVTDEDLRKGFEANYGPGVEVLAIVLGNQRIAQEVWQMARNNPTSTYFGELASQYSIEPVSRANMGEVPPIRKFSGQDLIEEEAFNKLAKEDPLSSIVAVGDRYIIMFYLGKTKPIVDDFEAVKDELKKEIHEKKLRLAMAEEFDRLRESAQIDNFLAGTTQAGKTAARPAVTSPKLAKPVSSAGKSVRQR